MHLQKLKKHKENAENTEIPTMKVMFGSFTGGTYSGTSLGRKHSPERQSKGIPPSIMLSKISSLKWQRCPSEHENLAGPVTCAKTSSMTGNERISYADCK